MPLQDLHVVLLGDSIFDNAAYVGTGPAVIDQVRAAVSGTATLLAVDGDCTPDVAQQLAGLPATATHLMISVGGNDALGQLAVLGETVVDVAGALTKLAELSQRFVEAYGQMLETVCGTGLPVGVCTVYDPNYGDPRQQQVAVAALAGFNDAIQRAAFRRGLPVIDLRVLFSDASHYANPIEPSSLGGARIARSIARLVREHDFARQRSVVYADL